MKHFSPNRLASVCLGKQPKLITDFNVNSFKAVPTTPILSQYDMWVAGTPRCSDFQWQLPFLYTVQERPCLPSAAGEADYREAPH